MRTRWVVVVSIIGTLVLCAAGTFAFVESTHARVSLSAASHPAAKTHRTDAGAILRAFGTGPPTTPAAPATTTTSASVQVLPVRTPSITAKFTTWGCAIVRAPSGTGTSAQVKGSVTTPPLATKSAGQLELELVDGATSVIATSARDALNDGQGSYFFTLGVDVPHTSQPAACVVLWLSPESIPP